MPASITDRPQKTEYAQYYGKYIDLVGERDIIGAMEKEMAKTSAYLRSLPPGSGEKRYAADKWTIKQVIGHLIDTEKVFSSRALFFARGAPGPLPGIEQEEWMNFSPFNAQKLDELTSEFESVRQSTIYFFKSLDADAWTRQGKASGFDFTVRSLAYIILGHERHHLEILKTRYS